MKYFIMTWNLTYLTPNLYSFIDGGRGIVALAVTVTIAFVWQQPEIANLRIVKLLIFIE